MSTASTTTVPGLTGDQLEALTTIRQDVANDLTAAGFTGSTYRGANSSIGAAIVIPGRPYLSWRSTPDDPLGFGEVRVNLDVLLLERPENTPQPADQLDQRISAAVQALDARASRLGGFGVSEVSSPGIHNLGTAKYLAVVVSTTEHHRF